MRGIKIRWKTLILSLIIVFAAAFIGSIFTSSQTDSDWYNGIRPKITPPNWVFPVVWNILFFLIALSLYFAWVSSKRNKKKVALLFGINFLLNILWSVFYFGMKNPALAFFDLILLWASIVTLIIFLHKINKKSSYLLIPYFAWVSFAGILNYLSI